jgi:hypothetical protein
MKLVLGLTALAIAALTTAAFAASTNGPQAAVAQACVVRADIGSYAANFPAYVVSPGTPAGVQADLQGIRQNLATIRQNLRLMPVGLRRVFGVASVAFVRQLGRITPALLSAPGGPASLRRFARFRLATTQTIPVYQRTLGRVAC